MAVICRSSPVPCGAAPVLRAASCCTVGAFSSWSSMRSSWFCREGGGGAPASGFGLGRRLRLVLCARVLRRLLPPVLAGVGALVVAAVLWASPPSSLPSLPPSLVASLPASWPASFLSSIRLRAMARFHAASRPRRSGRTCGPASPSAIGPPSCMPGASSSAVLYAPHRLLVAAVQEEEIAFDIARASAQIDRLRPIAADRSNELSAQSTARHAAP